MIKIIVTVMILRLSPAERKIALVAFLLHADVYRPSHPLGLLFSSLDSGQYNNKGVWEADSKFIGNFNFEWSLLCACLGNVIAGFRESRIQTVVPILLRKLNCSFSNRVMILNPLGCKNSIKKKRPLYRAPMQPVRESKQCS